MVTAPYRSSNPNSLNVESFNWLANSVALVVILIALSISLSSSASAVASFLEVDDCISNTVAIGFELCQLAFCLVQLVQAFFRMLAMMRSEVTVP